MELQKTQFLTSVNHRIPTPAISLNSSGNLLIVISNWGESSKTKIIQKILADSVESKKNSEAEKPIIEKLSEGFIKANDFLLTSSNINTWNTVVEVFAVYSSKKTISWVNASSISIYKKIESSLSPEPLNPEHINKMQKISSINQASPLPFFGIGLQSSLELDSGESSIEDTTELLALNSMRTPLLLTEVSSVEPSDALELIAAEFPNSAAWASSFKIKT